MTRTITIQARPHSRWIRLGSVCALLLLLASCLKVSQPPTTDPLLDSTAPTVPTGLAATVASSTQINLAWTAPTDNVGVTGYSVERCQGPTCLDFEQIAAPVGLSLSDTGLAPSTSYSYRVRATDAAGNLSDYSNTSTASTLGTFTDPFADDFNRVDVNPIAGNWTTSFTAGGAIVGNELTGGGAGDNFIFLNWILPPPNQYAKITFVSTGNNNSLTDGGGPVVRGDASGNGYLLDVVSNDNPGDSSWRLFRVAAGSGTDIVPGGGRIGRPLRDGDVLEIRAVGSVISGYLNGDPILGASATDTTYPTGGFGVHLFRNTGRWDNFEGGSL